MSNIPGFAMWCMRGSVREPIAWGFLLNVLAFVALITGCPAPWPQYMSMAGMTILVMSVLYHVIAISYNQYQRELDETARELRRKQ
jgi:hypothetical protein